MLYMRLTPYHRFAALIDEKKNNFSDPPKSDYLAPEQGGGNSSHTISAVIIEAPIDKSTAEWKQRKKKMTRTENYGENEKRKEQEREIAGFNIVFGYWSKTPFSQQAPRMH